MRHRPSEGDATRTSAVPNTWVWDALRVGGAWAATEVRRRVDRLAYRAQHSGVRLA